ELVTEFRAIAQQLELRECRANTKHASLLLLASGHEPSLIGQGSVQSASYPRSASSIDPDLRRDESAPREARRSAGPADQQGRVDHQSENCQGARPQRPAAASGSRRRGDRVMGWMAPLRHLSAKLLSDRIGSDGSHPWARLLRSDWTWRSMF